MADFEVEDVESEHEGLIGKGKCNRDYVFTFVLYYR